MDILPNYLLIVVLRMLGGVIDVSEILRDITLGFLMINSYILLINLSSSRNKTRWFVVVDLPFLGIVFFRISVFELRMDEVFFLSIEDDFFFEALIVDGVLPLRLVDGPCMPVPPLLLMPPPLI